MSIDRVPTPFVCAPVVAAAELLEPRRLFAGVPDSTFSGDGIVSTDIGFTEEVHALPGGKVMAIGLSETSNNLDLRRYNANGALDTSFSGDGKATTSLISFFSASLVQADGKILLSGTDGNDVGILVRFNADGSLDNSFGTNGVASARVNTGHVHSLIQQPDGKILGLGIYREPGVSRPQLILTRYNTNGSADNTFNFGSIVRDIVEYSRGYWSDYTRTDLRNSCFTLAPDGRIIVCANVAGGFFGPSSAFFFEFLPDGRIDRWASGQDRVAIFLPSMTQESVVTDIDVAHDRQIIAVGETGGGWRVWRMLYGLSNFQLDTNWGGGDGIIQDTFAPTSFPRDVEVRADGRILVMGNGLLTTTSTPSSLLLARYQPDGALDTAFGDGNDGTYANTFGGSFVHNDFSVGSDGSIAAGYFDGDHVGESPMYLLKLTGDATGAITGTVFDDNDLDGVQDPTDFGLINRTVYLDLNDNGSLDAGEPTAVTDTRGQYILRDVAPGTHVLRNLLGPTEVWRQSLPSFDESVGRTITLEKGQAATGQDFGMYEYYLAGLITGDVFDDADEDGLFSPGTDVFLAGRTVYLDANNNGLLDGSERSAVTGTNGTFALDVAPGTHVVRQLLPAGQVQTAPAANAPFSVTVAANQSAKVSFGTVQKGPVQSPYHGSPFAIGGTPATIQAEDFDLGGSGIAFHDTTANNIGGLYRPNEAVDIKSQAAGQFRISDAVAGEWLEYSIDVATAGNYELEFRVSHADPNSKVHAEIDGVNVTGSMTVPDTNSHNTFASVKRTVALTAGKHVLRFAWDANAANGYAASFDWIKVTKVTTPEPPPPPGPGTTTIVSTVGSYVRNGSFAGQNFGTSNDLIVKRSGTTGNTREIYLKFDLSSVTSINTAKLRLHGRLSDTQNANVLTRIYSASNTSWSETGLTWNNKPAAGSTVRGSLTVTGTTAAWYEVDLTSFLKAELAAGRKVVTLVLKNPNTSDAQTLFSSDETANGPQLVVT